MRCTSTAMVFAVLALTTVPCRVREAFSGASAMSLLSVLCAQLALHGLQARDVAARLAELVGLGGLAGGPLQPQRELRLAQFDQVDVQVGGLLAAGLLQEVSDPLDFLGHQRTCRFTKDVVTESFAPARRNASRAVASGTPSISNRTLPGCTFATQYSTLPLPAPMRTSSGFFETGTSGNTRTQIWPPRFTARAMARRAASISRAVMRARSVAFRPNSPNATVEPRCARPVLRPLNCLRYLVRFGCNIVLS